MSGAILCLALWLAAFIWSARVLIRTRKLLSGGLILTALSLIPTIYGRSATPPEWHDYPLMGLYYLPTMLAALFALSLVVIGLLRLLGRAFLSQPGT